MTIPIRLTPVERDPVAEYLASRDAGVDPVSDYLAAKKIASPKTLADVTAAKARNRNDVSGDYEVLGRGLAANALNAAQGIPGMETFEAGMGELGSQFTDHPLNYEQSLDALRSQTKAIPAALSIPEKMIVGGRVIGSMLPSSQPASVVKSVAQGAGIGAGLGVADAALQADPLNRVSISQRMADAARNMAIGGGIGAGFGAAPGVADWVRNTRRLGQRVAETPSVGEQGVNRSSELSDTDARNFGLVRAQSAAHETSPILQRTLSDPVIDPYVKMVRGTEEFASANDGDVATEAHALINEDRGGLRKQLEKEPSAALRLKERQLGRAAERLKHALASPSEKPPLTLDVAPEEYLARHGGVVIHPNETEPLIESARPRLEGPTPRTTTDVPTETGAQRSAREAMQRQSGLRGARNAGPVEGQAVETALDRPTIRPTSEQPTPEFTVSERQERVVRPGVSVQVPAMRIETAPAEQVGPVAAAFPQATAESSALRGQTKVFNAGYTDGLRIMGERKARSVADAAKTSVEAIARKIQTMNPDDADQYLQGILAAGKTAKTPLPSAHQTLFGTLAKMARPVMQRNRLSPFVNALDVQMGNRPPLPTSSTDMLRLLGILNAPMANP